MASLISCATGNFTSSSTWALVDSTSLLDSENTTTASLSSYVYSSTFTPGAITVDGISIKFSSVGSSGTFSVELFNNTDTVSVTSVTVNLADIQLGWNFFKFASNQTLTAGKAYKVGIKHSSSSSNIFRDATAANWSRMLRTTTTQAPAASDQLVVIGELTGAGTGNSFTVTMNNTATTTFGTVSFTQSMSVANRGTLTWGTSASTNYYLKVKGLIDVMGGGTWNMGTSGTRMPTTSTAVLEFDCTANVDSGIRFNNGSTFSVYGAAKTRWTTMTADKAAAATVIALTDTTGWATSDSLVFASTTRTTTQTETKSIATVDSSTQVTLSAGLTNAHTGTGLVVGEVGNLTSNVRIRGISTSLQGYMVIADTASGTIDNAEIYQMGSGTSLKRGINATTSTGSLTINSCSIHDFIVATSIGLITSGTAWNNVTASSNVFYNCAGSHISNGSTSATNYAITNNLCMTSTSIGIQLADAGGTITGNIVVSSSSTGWQVNDLTAGSVGTFSGNIAHTNAGQGFVFRIAKTCVPTSVKSYLNSSSGFNFETSNGCVSMESPIAFGNSGNNIAAVLSVFGAGVFGEILVRNGTFDSLTGFTTASHLTLSGAVPMWTFENCAFGATLAATTSTVLVSGTGIFSRVIMRNCTFAESTFISSQTGLDVDSFVLTQRHNGTAGDHRGYFGTGNSVIDTTIYNAASPSLRLTPNNASSKLLSSPLGRGFNVAVTSGSTCAVSVYVRKSVIGDGTAYNGNQPRLWVRKNVSLGITADTLLATASGSAGSWEQLTGTTASVTDDGWLEFFVDCDGTTGWVNIDDFASTTVNDSKGLKFFDDGLPLVSGDNISSGGATTGYFSY